MKARVYTRAGAEFSPDGSYRFKLWRRFNVGAVGRIVAFIMLNPSTAGASDDPTVRRCVDYARRWGFDGVDVVNLFAIVSTDPTILRARPFVFREATGDPRCLEALIESAMGAARVVAAWGAQGEHHAGRVNEVLTALRRCRTPLWAFEGATKSGEPKHPLRLRGDLGLRVLA